MAPMSMTQVLESYALLLTIYAEKTEWERSILAIVVALEDTTLAIV